jgi:hypothetical protein
MKHVVERAIGKYVTNGAFIAAGFVAGHPFEYTAGPNVLFGMSARDVERIDSAGRHTRGRIPHGRVSVTGTANGHRPNRIAAPTAVDGTGLPKLRRAAR